MLTLAITALAPPPLVRAQDASLTQNKIPAGPGFATSLPGMSGATLPNVGTVTAAAPSAASSTDDESNPEANAAATPSAQPSAEIGDSIRKSSAIKRSAASAQAAGAASSKGVIVQAAATPPTAKTASRRPHGVRAATATAAAVGTATASTASKNDSQGSGPFSALQLSSGHGPINIKSDTLELDYKHNTVVFNGHVHAVQAGATLTSDSLKVLYGKNFHQVKEMFADGNVRMSQGTRWATGEHAVLNQAAHTVTLTGNPVVHDGPDQITGSRIIVHLDSGKSEVIGARAVLFPKQGQTRDNKGALAGHKS